MYKIWTLYNCHLHYHQHWQDLSHWQSLYFALKSWKIVFLKVIIRNHNFLKSIRNNFLPCFIYIYHICTLNGSLSSILTRLKQLKVSIFYIQIQKNSISKGHYLKPQFSRVYQKQLFTLSYLYLWYLYTTLSIIINIDKIKATESLHILHSNSEKSYF